MGVFFNGHTQLFLDYCKIALEKCMFVAICLLRHVVLKVFSCSTEGFFASDASVTALSR
jgi:hypothetical protein